MNVLEFFGEPLSYGGQEAFIINMYKNFKRNDIKYTFATPFFSNNKELVKLAKKRNDKIVAFNYDFYSKERKRFIIKSINKIVKQKKYDVVHIHSGSIFTLYIVAKIAKESGIGKVIVHSHATGYNNFKHKIIKFICNLKFNRYADYFFACSLEAGNFKYSKQIMKSSKFKIINNGINLEKFKFNISKREEYRKKYEFGDKHVICHVGRFSEEKNHIFLLQVFKEYLDTDNKAILVLIGGSGPMEKSINDYIKENNLIENVKIFKERDDVFDFLNASDIFVFPSKFEGLGISVIEAQASGLNAICSDNVPSEAQVTDNFIKLSLDDSLENWASSIKLNINKERKDVTIQIKQNGYDIKDCAAGLEKYYLEDKNIQ